MFQFTPARSGRRPAFTSHIRCLRSSNSRPREAGDLIRIVWIEVPRKFQFTPARSGRPSHGLSFPPPFVVPIHARAKRATSRKARRNWRPKVVPIHARAKRATSQCLTSGVPPRLFQFTPARSGRPRHPRHHRARTAGSNSRPREAGDGARVHLGHMRDVVPIHARAKRATAGSLSRVIKNLAVPIHARAKRATHDPLPDAPAFW